MKIKYSLLVALTSICMLANAQDYKRWGISLHGGVPIMQGDGDIANLIAGGGASIKYVFANNFSLRVGGMFGQMNSKNLSLPNILGLYRSTNKYMEGSAQANLNLVNFKKTSTGRNIAQLYLGAGIGYAIANLTYDKQVASSVNTLIIPYGVGMKFYISPVVDLGFELSQRVTFTDDFDGNAPVSGNSKSNDFYTIPQIYITFNLGSVKGSRSLEWTEPTEKLYEEMIKAKQEAQEQIDIVKKENAALTEKMKTEMEAQMSANKRKTDSLILAVKESFKIDSDGDGVSDVFDKEPNTPAGALVDGAGRMMDTDKDGIPDFKDKCPTLPGKESNNGCPVQPTKQQLAIISDGIKNLQFETGKAIIQPSSFPALDKLADLLLENPSFNFRIEGHTDNVGAPEKNRILSQERAEAVKTYLTSRGVDAERITAVGYGDTKPVVSNDTAAGKAKNRRVDMAIE